MIPFPYLSAHPTGSRYTVQPAVLTTDDDWLVLVDSLQVVKEYMDSQPPEPWLGWPWDQCTHAYNPDVEDADFIAWRNETTGVNLIVTDDPTFYLRSVSATLLAAKLNLKTKEERIALFRAIKFGDDYTGRLP